MSSVSNSVPSDADVDHERTVSIGVQPAGGAVHTEHPDSVIRRPQSHVHDTRRRVNGRQQPQPQPQRRRRRPRIEASSFAEDRAREVAVRRRRLEQAQRASELLRQRQVQQWQELHAQQQQFYASLALTLPSRSIPVSNTPFTMPPSLTDTLLTADNIPFPNSFAPVQNFTNQHETLQMYMLPDHALQSGLTHPFVPASEEHSPSTFDQFSADNTDMLHVPFDAALFIPNNEPSVSQVMDPNLLTYYTEFGAGDSFHTFDGSQYAIMTDMNPMITNNSFQEANDMTDERNPTTAANTAHYHGNGTTSGTDALAHLRMHHQHT